jgi:2-phospho-L-lactate transferase/gluconeogenesis factor (CofD/UPF0052 family)
MSKPESRQTGTSENLHQPAENLGLRVVAMGGGTGLSTLLKGLKQYVPAVGAAVSSSEDGPIITDLTAVVTVTDDGGSSGLLRKEFNILPPGDIRNCIVALSEDEALLARLFQFRFPADSGLHGHNFGNLFLTALNSMTSDFAEAVKLASEVLATRGRIFPSTTANVRLEAQMDDGSRQTQHPSPRRSMPSPRQTSSPSVPDRSSPASFPICLSAVFPKPLPLHQRSKFSSAIS